MAASKYIAFLRAINVGNRNIKMADLRMLFEEMGFANVETFIASGNVIFDTPSQLVPELEQQIEAHLAERLGYTVDTFIRTPAQLAEIVAHEPFGPIELVKGGNTLYVAFLAKPLDDEAKIKLFAQKTAVDDFQVKGSEAYWLHQKQLGDSKFSGGVLEKVIGAPATLRNVNTIRRLAKKYPPEAG